MSIIIIDIETGISEDALLFKSSFEPNKTLKDEKKIEADLLKKESEWVDRCALSALTGEVLAIGYYNQMLNGSDIADKSHYSERVMLNQFWILYSGYLKDGHTLCGHNLKGFDLPFLYRRSLKYGIKPLWKPSDRYNQQIQDTMEIWNCNQYPKEYISLDNLAKFLAIGQKTGSGKDFAKLFKNPETKQQALDYLKSDLELTYKVAKILTQ